MGPRHPRTCMGPSILLLKKKTCINKFLQELHYASRLYYVFNINERTTYSFIYLCHSQTCQMVALIIDVILMNESIFISVVYKKVKIFYLI
jgi:hypothetical protein